LVDLSYIFYFALIDGPLLVLNSGDYPDLGVFSNLDFLAGEYSLGFVGDVTLIGGLF
jgi:hypothetical protein